MRDPRAEAPVAPPQELGFWGKTKLAVKGFVKGTLEAAPKAVLFSSAAFIGSAALGSFAGEGYNFLAVDGFTKETVGRVLGATFLSSSISGAWNGFQAVRHADDAPVQNTPAQPRRAPTVSAVREPEVAFDGAPPMTPMGNRVNTNRPRL